MKLIRFGDRGMQKPGILTAGGLRTDCSAWFKDWDHELLQHGGIEKLGRLIQSGDQLPDVTR
jgi:hypothetical protein